MKLHQQAGSTGNPDHTIKADNPAQKAGVQLALTLAVALVLTGCSDSGGGGSIAAESNDNSASSPADSSSSNTDSAGSAPVTDTGSNDSGSTGGTTENTPAPAPVESPEPAPQPPAEQPAPQAPDNSAPDTDTSGQGTGDTTTGNGASAADNPVTTEVSATGSDLSGGEDDSPTATESLSLQGPFIRDESRSAGPPSVPEGLTLLLSGENWLELTWAPASDDQSVEGYEIYRDGTLLYEVRGDTGYEFDYRSWISTSYIDCNYTRYPNCTGNQPATGGSHTYTVAAVDNEGMRSAQSAPAVFQLAQRLAGPVDLTNYSVVLNEEFDAGSLDRNIWKTTLPWGPDTVINGERQYFVNIFGATPPAYDPFVFTGNTLQITGVATPQDQLAGANNLPYLSGVITTADHFRMTYGYVEMSARLAGGTGLLSTFYLFNQDFEKNKPEIDVVEYIGSRPDKIYQTYHYYDSNRARYATGEKHSSPTMEHIGSTNFAAGFHTYGVLWEEGLVVWYIDGVEVRRLTGTRVADEPMNIIAQLVIGSEWIGDPDPANIPAVFEIDYIRAWQRN